MAAYRTKIPVTVIDLAGTALSFAVNAAQATIYIRNADGTPSATPATVYSSESGGTLAQPLQADANGRLPGWLARGRYVATVSATGLATYNEPIDVAVNVEDQDTDFSNASSTLKAARIGLGTAPASSYRLALPAGTTPADGIGFGTDAELYRVAAGVVGLSGRLDITSATNSTSLFGIGPLRGDEETVARAKVMAFPSSFTGTWSNGARGDQLYNDATNGPVFTNGALFYTNQVTFNKPGTLVGLMVDLDSGEVESSQAITSVGAPGNVFTSAAHGYAVGDVATISGATTGTWTDINGTWRISAVTTNTFTCASCTNADTGTPSGTPVVLRHIYHDVDGVKSSVTANAPGGNVVNEWGVTINAGKWAKGIGLEILCRDQNTYASWAASNNEVFQPTSNWRQTGSIGLALLATPTTPQGQFGTGIYISNYGGAPHFRRPFVVASGYADNTTATDLAVIDNLGQMALKGAQTVNQANPTSLSAALVLPGTNNVVADGIRFGTDANSVNLYRTANDILKTDDAFHLAGAFVAGGTSATISGTLVLTNATSSGYVRLQELASTPATPSDGAQVHTYMKGNKLVFQFNQGGTVKYYSLDLTQATAVDAPAAWNATQTAP